MSPILRAVTCVFALAVIYPAPAKGRDKVKVTHAATAPLYAPYFVAMDKGYYRANGIEVELIRAGGGPATAALLSRDVQFSTSGGAAVTAAVKGAPIVLLATMGNRLVLQIWSTRKEITKLKQLKGQPIGVISRGDLMEMATRVAMMREGMDWHADATFTPLGWGRATRLAAAKEGTLPGLVLSTLDVEALKSEGALANGNLIVDLFNEVQLPYNSVAVHAKFLETNRDLAYRFVKATIMGLRVARTKHNETLDILVAHNKRAPREVLRKDYATTRLAFTKDGTTAEELQKLDVTVRSDLLKIAVNKRRAFDAIYDYDLAKRANQELDKAGWIP